jgi:hypothetical protein
MYRRCLNCGSTDIGLFHIPSRFGRTGNFYYCEKCDSTLIEESPTPLHRQKTGKPLLDPKDDPDSVGNSFKGLFRIPKIIAVFLVVAYGIFMATIVNDKLNFFSLLILIPVSFMFTLGLFLLVQGR